MELIKNLWKKFVTKETISYLVFGVLTTVVSLVSYKIATILLTGGGEPDIIQVQLSTVISWVLAVAFAYITNKLFVFGSKSFETKLLLKEISAFVGARILSLLYEMIWMYVTVKLLNMNDFLCKFIAQFVIVVLNYLFSKLFIFKKK